MSHSGKKKNQFPFNLFKGGLSLDLYTKKKYINKNINIFFAADVANTFKIKNMRGQLESRQMTLLQLISVYIYWSCTLANKKCDDHLKKEDLF